MTQSWRSKGLMELRGRKRSAPSSEDEKGSNSRVGVGEEFAHPHVVASLGGDVLWSSCEAGEH